MGEEKDSDSVGVAMRLPQGTSQNGVLPSEEKIQLKIETEEVLVQSLTNGNAARRENGEKGSMEDDELTSLSWLQDNNLLKNIRMGTYGDEAEDLLSDSPTSDFLEDPLDLSGDHVGREFSRGAPSGYNPKLHIYAKPPYSFSCLIFMAIENSPNKALPVKDIYSWILTHFPYFHNAPTGWKNSVRHNLSLNKCFRKVNKDVGQNIGKGSLWSIDPEFRPNLLHAVRRAPYHPYNQLNNFHRLSVQSVSAQNIGTDKPTPLTPAQSNVNVPSPGDPEVDAAATMLELKNGPQLQAGSENGNENKSGCHRKKLKRNHPARISTSDPDEEVDRAVRSGKLAPVITSSPSEDHTYSASPSRPGVNFSSSVGTNSPGSSIDEPFEFSDGSSRKSDNSNGFSSQETEEDDEDCSQEAEHTAKQREEEERKKLTEGAQALLNLAKGATIKKRQYSQKCSSSDTSRHQQDDR